MSNLFLNIIGCVLALALTAVTILFGRVVYRHYSNPATVYSVIWGVGLVLVTTRFSDAFFPIDNLSYLIFIMAFLAFSLGVIVAAPLHERYLPVNGAWGTKRGYLALVKIYHPVALFALLGSFGFLIMTLNFFGLEQWLYKGYVVHELLLTGDKSETFPGGVWVFRLVQYAIHPAIYIGACLSGMLILAGNRVKLQCFMPLLAAVLFDAAMVGRFRAYSVLLILMAAYVLRAEFVSGAYEYLKHGVKRLRHLSRPLLAIALLVVVLYFVLAEVRTYDKNIYSIYGLNVPGLLFEPIKYQFGGLYLFSVAKEAYGELTGGWETFYPLFRLLSYVGLSSGEHVNILSDPSAIGPESIMNGFHTYLFAPYRDYGFAGILVIPFMLGLLSGYIYQRVMIGKAYYWVPALLAIYGLVIMPSTVTWPFSDLSRSIAVLVPLIIGLFFELLRAASRTEAEKAAP